MLAGLRRRWECPEQAVKQGLRQGHEHRDGKAKHAREQWREEYGHEVGRQQQIAQHERLGATTLERNRAQKQKRHAKRQAEVVHEA